MSSSIPQTTIEVKLIELIIRANSLMLALASDEDEDTPVGRAIADWLRDAGVVTGDDCRCVLPEQSCLVCKVAAREVYGDGDELPF